MSTAADYVGRTVNLWAFRPAAFRSEVLLEQRFVGPGDAGQVIAGIEKLAQRYFRTLLTPKGSVPYHADDGTAFTLEARAGGWRTAADLAQAFAFAEADVRAQLLREELPGDPADERYGTSELLGAVLTGDRIVARVHLLSAAGEGRRYLTPLPVSLSVRRS